MNEQTRETIVEASRPVRWAAAAALAMLALFLIVKTLDSIALFGEGQNPTVNTITVTGEGTSSATPDIARISFSVQESATTVSAAQDAATKKTNDALAAVKGLGVADEDVKTSDYSISPQYSQSNPCGPGVYCLRPVTNSNTITGYQVSQTVNVTVHDTSKAGDIIGKLGDLGVQNVSGPNFAVDDDNGVMSDARAKAIENAHDKAQELAKELGVSLGDVVSYSDQGGVYPMYKSAAGMAMDSAVASAPTLPTGTDERTVDVQVTYRIK